MSRPDRLFRRESTLLAAVVLTLAVVSSATRAEDAAPPAPTSTPTPSTAAAPPETKAAEGAPPALPALSWLAGCWQGTVNKREFREQWMPMRGGLMLGVSQTVMGDKTLDFEYLRLEARADGVYYVASAPGKPEAAFRLASETVDQEDAHTFSFLDPSRDFPSRIGYRRASEGWLYTEVEGKVNGAQRKVIYPMRRIDCQTGEFIGK